MDDFYSANGNNATGTNANNVADNSQNSTNSNNNNNNNTNSNNNELLTNNNNVTPEALDEHQQYLIRQSWRGVIDSTQHSSMFPQHPSHFPHNYTTNNTNKSPFFPNGFDTSFLREPPQFDMKTSSMSSSSIGNGVNVNSSANAFSSTFPNLYNCFDPLAQMAAASVGVSPLSQSAQTPINGAGLDCTNTLSQHPLLNGVAHHNHSHLSYYNSSNNNTTENGRNATSDDSAAVPNSNPNFVPQQSSSSSSSSSHLDCHNSNSNNNSSVVANSVAVAAAAVAAGYYNNSHHHHHHHNPYHPHHHAQYPLHHPHGLPQAASPPSHVSSTSSGGIGGTNGNSISPPQLYHHHHAHHHHAHFNSHLQNPLSGPHGPGNVPGGGGGCPGNMPPSIQDQINYDPRELEVFSEKFKQRRIKLGVTQADVGKALGNLKLNGVGSLSQSTICRFESLTLSHNNMVALKPILQAWLEEAERQAAERVKNPDLFSDGLDRKRKRTSITDAEKRSLEAYFAVQPRPSSEKIAQIADKLNLKKNVVRVWFCNQRQKQKRMKFSTIGMEHHAG